MPAGDRGVVLLDHHAGVQAATFSMASTVSGVVSAPAAPRVARARRGLGARQSALRTLAPDGRRRGAEQAAAGKRIRHPDRLQRLRDPCVVAAGQLIGRRVAQRGHVGELAGELRHRIVPRDAGRAGRVGPAAARRDQHRRGGDEPGAGQAYGGRHD